MYRVFAHILLKCLRSEGLLKLMKLPIELTSEGEVTLPSNIKVRPHISCADLCIFQNRYYLAVRTASIHYPYPDALIHILSSADGKNWQAEHCINVPGDLREPRFVVFKDVLHLYFFAGSSVPFVFYPRGIFVTRKTPAGWDAPAKVFRAGFVHWRIRPHHGKLLMSVYSVLRVTPSRLSNVFLLQSRDGFEWNAVTSEPLFQGLRGPSESSELEFNFGPDGTMYGVLRSDILGSRIFAADGGDLSKRRMRDSKFRYDSALLFSHDYRSFLIARRNLDGSPNKAGRRLPKAVRIAYNLTRYSLTKKRTSLFTLNPETLELQLLFDIPSHGDTGFPALCPINDHEYLLVNYSSELRGEDDYPWIRGQFRPTKLYAYRLSFGQ
jgi:hypothetical protein